MQTSLKVLSDNEKSDIHEAGLVVLAETGLRVDSARARKLLSSAGAEVDENSRLVKFPRGVVEEALRLAPKKFTLGARREGWQFDMNAGNTVLSMDGQGVSTYDAQKDEVHPSTYRDFMNATILANAVDEVGVYWNIVTANDRGETKTEFIGYVRDVLKNFTKHIQEPVSTEGEAELLREILHIVFGSTEDIKKNHPWSFLLCPQSPLVMEEQYTDAYLAMVGLDIPVGAMPMPLMGATAPASLAGTAVLGNSEVLAALCLVQAAEPGAPFIYSPALALMDPRTGGYHSGAVENGIMGAVETEMARFYDLPVMASGGSSSHFIPNIQSGIERSMGGLLTALSLPDIMVGPGLLGGSMILSLEQFLLDVEIFKMSRRAAAGIRGDKKHLFGDVISRVGPAGHFLGEDSTVDAIRSDEWFLSNLFVFSSYDEWAAGGRKTTMEQAREKVDHILTAHEEEPFPDEVERELEQLEKKFRERE